MGDVPVYNVSMVLLQHSFPSRPAFRVVELPIGKGAGDREGVGKMFFSDALAYWIGPVEAVEGLVGEARFGVTLVTLDGSADGQDVLEGDL